MLAAAAAAMLFAKNDNLTAWLSAYPYSDMLGETAFHSTCIVRVENRLTTHNCHVMFSSILSE